MQLVDLFVIFGQKTHFLIIEDHMKSRHIENYKLGKIFRDSEKDGCLYLIAD